MNRSRLSDGKNTGRRPRSAEDELFSKLIVGCPHPAARLLSARRSETRDDPLEPGALRSVAALVRDAFTVQTARNFFRRARTVVDDSARSTKPETDVFPVKAIDLIFFARSDGRLIETMRTGEFRVFVFVRF